MTFELNLSIRLNKLTITREEEGITGERRGTVKSKNMYKGPMDKDNRAGGTECGRKGVGRAGDSNGGKWGQLQLNYNK